ncbi:MAG TPA: class I SAM-dependent methyltransferase [Oligoflexus sp.]|uniref:class I SAM-dependent methyltransferase n=1 Tax=Oligoflexus sp. TaxID=1971216 RepID=UPI002D802504|nr:class I SAM-dependent methyltransferase [Oligoflexus sp.]HET9241602.1 class I SAM-dependent methyltransferase [Oligoflexus sp.]
MNSCDHCPFCPDSGDYQKAKDKAQIPAIVRAFQHQTFTVWRCESCGSLHSKEDVNLPLYYEGYPFAQHKLDFWSRVAYRKRTRDLVKQGIQKHHKILDYGCGAGVFVQYLRDQGYVHAVGYDPYVAAFAEAARLKEQYDAVLAQDVIEHADDPRVMLQEILSCLKPDGLLYLGTPLANRIRLKQHERFAMSLHQPYHRHIFSLKALLDLTRSYGLRATGLSERHCTDTLTPTVNTRFLHEFIRAGGNVVDVGFEPPPPDLFKRHPRLLLFAFFGYFFSQRSELSGYFRRSLAGT